MYFAPSLTACAITPGLLFSSPAIFWRRAFRLLRYFGDAPFVFCDILAAPSAILWRRHLRYFGDVPFAICDVLATCLFASCVCDILAMRLFAFCAILATRLSLPAIFWRRAFRHLRYFGDVPFVICDILVTCLFASCDILVTRLSASAIFWRRPFRHLRYFGDVPVASCDIFWQRAFSPSGIF